jgi:TRAP-type C4-dicarboxylate transport system substrate-binding protein
MYEPVMISARSWDRLNEAQREALRAAGANAEAFFNAAGAEQDAEAERIFAEAGVEVAHLSEAQLTAWREIAASSSYETFAADVDGGRELIELALSVE